MRGSVAKDIRKVVGFANSFKLRKISYRKTKRLWTRLPRDKRRSMLVDLVEGTKAAARKAGLL